MASAAREISLGHYDIRLSANAKERELGELIASFKEMAGKLKQLDHSRTFMLAGLTHELKTPVTSEKGLVHAVKEKVVQNEEADEFLKIALQETGRLERMIADLLDYNALAAGLVHGFAEIVISDNGSGIPSSEQALVFERFFRGSKLLAQAQKGDLALRESSEEGTAFSLAFCLNYPVIR